MQTPRGSGRKGQPGSRSRKGASTAKKSSASAASAASSSRKASTASKAAKKTAASSARKKSPAARVRQQSAAFDEAHAALLEALEDFMRHCGPQDEPIVASEPELPAKFAAQLGGVDRVSVRTASERVIVSDADPDAEVSAQRAFALPEGIFEAEAALFQIKSELLPQLERAVDNMAQILVESETQGSLGSSSWLEQREILERYSSEYELAESICVPLARDINADVLRTHTLALRARPFMQA